MNRTYEVQNRVPSHRPIRAQPEAGVPDAGTRKKRLNLWKNIGAQANDNGRHASSPWKVAGWVASFILLCGVLVSMNGSIIVTQAVLHADDAVLSTAMDISPDSMATALNMMDVGE